MGSPSTVTQRRQLGVETTPGTAVAATSIVEGLSLTPAVEVETEAYRPDGSKHVSTVARMREHSSVDVSGFPCYRGATYLLASLVGNMQTEQIGEFAYRHTFETRARDTDELATYTIERGATSGDAVRATYAQIAAAQIAFSKAGSSSTLSGSGFARSLETGRNLSGNTVQTLTIEDAVTGAFRLTLGGGGGGLPDGPVDISSAVTIDAGTTGDPTSAMLQVTVLASILDGTDGDILISYAHPTLAGDPLEVVVPISTIVQDPAAGAQALDLTELLEIRELDTQWSSTVDGDTVTLASLFEDGDPIEVTATLSNTSSAPSGDVSDPIAYDADAQTIEAVLQALLGAGTVTVTGGPLTSGTVSITFVGPFAQTAVDTLTVIDNTVQNDLDEPVEPLIVRTEIGAPAVIIPTLPITPEHIEVYADSTAALLGTTRLGRATQVEIDISDRVAPVFYLTGAGSFDELVEAALEATYTLSVAADRDGVDLGMTALREGQRIHTRVRATGPALGDSHYALTVDAVLEVEGVQAFSDEDGVYAITYDLRVVHDVGAGYAQRFELVNDLPTLI